MVKMAVDRGWGSPAWAGQAGAGQTAKRTRG